MSIEFFKLPAALKKAIWAAYLAEWKKKQAAKKPATCLLYTSCAMVLAYLVGMVSRRFLKLAKIAFRPRSTSSVRCRSPWAVSYTHLIQDNTKVYHKFH